MAITTLSSREFNQDAGRAKKAAERGPVFITDRGRPAHVLLTIEDYLAITGKRESIVDLLAMPEADEIEFEPPRLSGSFQRSAEFDWCTCSIPTVVSELRKVRAGNPNVRSWAKDIPPSTLFLSAITILELEVEILRMELRDPAQGARLRSWFEKTVLPAFDGRILAVDIPVARRSAAMHVPTSCSDRDALIAATALVHRMTVVTRNVSDFQPTGAAIVNPWQA